MWSMRIYLAVLLIYGVQVACQYSFVALDQAPKAIFLTIWRKIILLIPLALKGVRYRPRSTASVLRGNLLVYGLGGVIAPFIGIKLIDIVISAVGLV